MEPKNEGGMIRRRINAPIAVKGFLHHFYLVPMTH